MRSQPNTRHILLKKCRDYDGNIEQAIDDYLQAIIDYHGPDYWQTLTAAAIVADFTGFYDSNYADYN